MFMRRILLLAAVALAAIQVLASPVDMRTAQAKAQNFVQQKLYSGKLRAPISGEMKLAHAEMNSKKLDRAVYYIFNSENGYVIVSGDDRAEEILGYGDTPLDINRIPDNMKSWLATYKVQLEYLQANEGLVVEAPSLNAPARIPSVEPLLTALWDQEAPYWNMCKINNYQCLTGCPATSAAMIFYYWKYPDFETPEVPGYRCYLSTSYYSGSYVNVGPLPPVTFDWDNMLDSYTSGYNTTQANAVATLMRYIGQAERMEYGTSSAGGSGVDADSVILMANAFTFFGYDEETVRVVKKTSAYSGGTTLYTDAEWAAIIQEELSEGRPILFCAIAGGFFGGGHAFNVDGYDATNNKYHINFGWSGDSNNYYALNAFNGGGSVFNQYQQMVIGIQPPMKLPRLKTNKSELTMSCYKNHTVSDTFTLTGRNLEGDVTLTLNDDNGVFHINESAITPDEDGKVSKMITVTYAPQAEGNYTATITCSAPGVDDVQITLNASSDYELYRPVMQAIDQQTVTANSFRADWTDATPAENVVSYSLEVKTKPAVNLTELESKTLVLAKEVDTYLVVLEIGNRGGITITTGYYPEIQSIKIYGGEIEELEPFTLRAPVETGDAYYRLIEGITPDKFYTVNGLLPNQPYLYRVKAYYVNGTESPWSNSREALTLAGETMPGDVNRDGVVSIDDVTMLIDYLLKGEGDIDLVAADFDQSGSVTIDDATTLIDQLLKGNE